MEKYSILWLKWKSRGCGHREWLWAAFFFCMVRSKETKFPQVIYLLKGNTRNPSLSIHLAYQLCRAAFSIIHRQLALFFVMHIFPLKMKSEFMLS